VYYLWYACMLLLKNAVGMISSISISFFFGLYIYLKHRTNTDYQCIHIYIFFIYNRKMNGMLELEI
jgi:hypothetical protein